MGRSILGNVLANLSIRRYGGYCGQDPSSRGIIYWDKRPSVVIKDTVFHYSTLMIVNLRLTYLLRFTDD